MKLIEIKAGRSLRVLMALHEITCKELATELNVIEQTIKSARTKSTISGNLLQSVCNYFEVSASEFFKIGE